MTVSVDMSTLYHAKTAVVLLSLTDTWYMFPSLLAILNVTPCSVPYASFTNSTTFSSSVCSSFVVSCSSAPT